MSRRPSLRRAAIAPRSTRTGASDSVRSGSRRARSGRPRSDGARPAVPRSGSRVALISVKPGAPVTLSSPDLGYEARGGDGKVLAQKLTAAEQKAAEKAYKNLSAG